MDYFFLAKSLTFVKVRPIPTKWLTKFENYYREWIPWGQIHIFRHLIRRRLFPSCNGKRIIVTVFVMAKNTDFDGAIARPRCLVSCFLSFIFFICDFTTHLCVVFVKEILKNPSIKIYTVMLLFHEKPENRQTFTKIHLFAQKNRRFCEKKTLKRLWFIHYI